MKLFKKIIKSLFKFVFKFTLFIVTTLVNFLIWVEFMLMIFNDRHGFKPSKTNEEYLNDIREEYKKVTSKKDIVVD